MVHLFSFYWSNNRSSVRRLCLQSKGGSHAKSSSRADACAFTEQFPFVWLSCAPASTCRRLHTGAFSHDGPPRRFGRPAECVFSSCTSAATMASQDGPTARSSCFTKGKSPDLAPLVTPRPLPVDDNSDAHPRVSISSPLYLLYSPVSYWQRQRIMWLSLTLSILRSDSC